VLFAFVVTFSFFSTMPRYYTMLVGWQRLALISPDGVAPSRMVGVSASVILPLHHKVQKFSSGTGSPGWSRKKGHIIVVVWWYYAKKLAGKNISKMTCFVSNCT